MCAFKSPFCHITAVNMVWHIRFLIFRFLFFKKLAPYSSGSCLWVVLRAVWRVQLILVSSCLRILLSSRYFALNYSFLEMTFQFFCMTPELCFQENSFAFQTITWLSFHKENHFFKLIYVVIFSVEEYTSNCR